ncbi:MAG: 4Fe-4S binding protein [Bacteroidaceae bacterium]|nr:4Fe-4S binding protein [Bacteroidaceae bacterium]
MKRTIIKIDEAKCDGCGLCVKGCHEGALQLIDGKATMVSELYCDGLGACIGDCPQGAITLEEREATPYNEQLVMERLIPKGEKVVQAHLKHLFEHDQSDLLQEAVDILQRNQLPIPQFKSPAIAVAPVSHSGGGCPGSKSFSFHSQADKSSLSPLVSTETSNSELQQWPVQLHLLSPTAPYWKGADLLLAADCTAYAVGGFHSRFLKGKRLAIACPKLDDGLAVYMEKITTIIDEGGINTLTVMIMEVPCCGGLLHLCQQAIAKATRKMPLKLIRVSIQGEILNEEWV